VKSGSGDALKIVAIVVFAAVIISVSSLIVHAKKSGSKPYKSGMRPFRIRRRRGSDGSSYADSYVVQALSSTYGLAEEETKEGTVRSLFMPKNPDPSLIRAERARLGSGGAAAAMDPRMRIPTSYRLFPLHMDSLKRKPKKVPTVPCFTYCTYTPIVQNFYRTMRNLGVNVQRRFFSVHILILDVPYLFITLYTGTVTYVLYK
jgi:hypothetical protein